MAPTQRDRLSGSTRERIVAAAGRLIDEVGIDKVSIADVADLAAVHRVTVYRHFADRDAVIDEVLLKRAEPVLARAADRLTTATAFPDGLASAMVAAVVDARGVSGLLRAMSIAGSGNPPTTHLVSERFGRRAAEVLRPFLERARERGELNPELSIDDTVGWLLQVCASWLLLTPDQSPEQMLKFCRTYVMPPLSAS